MTSFSVDAVVNTIPRSEVDSRFENSISNSTGVSEITGAEARDANVHSNLGVLIIEAFSPFAVGESTGRISVPPLGSFWDAIVGMQTIVIEFARNV
jgi:hypothetical protein